MATKPETAERARTEGVPRKWAPWVWGCAVLVLLVALPFGLSFVTERHGWTEDAGPSWLNLMGLAMVVAGLALLVWVLYTVYDTTEERVPYDMSPPDLVTYDAYAYCRHPMYLAVLMTWLGWAAFYGSLAVFVVTLLLAAGFEFGLAPQEERTLEKRHPRDYRRYKEDTPRWVPK